MDFASIVEAKDRALFLGVVDGEPGIVEFDVAIESPGHIAVAVKTQFHPLHGEESSAVSGGMGVIGEQEQHLGPGSDVVVDGLEHAGTGVLPGDDTQALRLVGLAGFQRRRPLSHRLDGRVDLDVVRVEIDPLDFVVRLPLAQAVVRCVIHRVTSIFLCCGPPRALSVTASPCHLPQRGR